MFVVGRFSIISDASHNVPGNIVPGKLFGKTPLIKLSPKKTVEGFVGAFFCTLLFALIVSSPRRNTLTS